MAKTQGNRGLNFSGSFDVDEILKNQKRVIQGFGDLKKAAQDAVNNGGRVDNSALKAAQLATQKALAESRLEVARLNEELKKLAIQYQEGKIAEQNYRTETAKLRAEKIALTNATKTANQAQKAATGSYKEAQQQLTALGNRIRGVEGGFNALGKVQRARIKEYNELNAKLKEFDAQLGNHQRNVGNYKSALGGIKGELTGMIASYVSLAAVIAGVSATFNQALKSDAVRTSLEFTFGSVDLADAKLEQLLETANRLGVNYNALTSSYKSFTGAVLASNFDFQEGERIFNAVAGASSKLKLSAEDTEGALRALQQMISKGNVQAEELRGQLGERIPGAFSIAARSMGKTEAQLNKMLQNGEVLASDLLPKLSRELEKTFSLESEEKVEGLSAAWERLKNVFSGTVGESGRITKFFEVIVDGVGRASQAIANMVNSSTWDEFWARFLTNDDGKTGDRIRLITDSFEKSAKVLKNVEGVDGTSEAKKIITSYEEVKISYEKALKALDAYKKGVADGSLIEKGTTTIKGMEQRVDALNFQLGKLKQILPKNSANTPVKSAAQLAKEEAAARKAQALRDKAQRELDAAQDRQVKLQEKIQDAIDKSNIKRLSAYEEDVANIKKYYSDLRAEAEKFNSDKKNKGLRVDVGGLAAPEKAALKDVDYKYETQAQVKELERQRKLFTDFEDYKSTYGKEKAIERFGDQSNLNKQLIEQLTTDNEAFIARSFLGGLTEEEKKRFEEKAQLLGEAKDYEIKTYEEIYLASVTYEQQRNGIIAQYEADAIALRAKGQEEMAKQAEINGKQQLDAFDSGIVKQLSGYEKLFEGFIRMSVKETQAYIDNAKKKVAIDLANGKITQKAYDEVIAAINNAQNALNSKFPEQLQKASEIFKELASDAELFGEGLANSLDVIGDMVGAVGNVKKGLSDAKSAIGNFSKTKKDAGGGLMGTITGAIGVAGPIADAIGAVAGIAKTVIGFFKAAKESAKKAQQEIATYNDNILKGEFEYNRVLRERERTLKDISKLSLKELDIQKALLDTQKSSAKQDYDRLLRQIQASGQQVTGIDTYKSGGFLGLFKTTKTKELTTGVAGLTFEQLEQLSIQGKLNASTEAWFKELQKAKEELEKIGVTTEDVLKRFNEIATGTTADAIASGIISGFKEGKKTAADFANDFNGLMEDALLSAFKDQYLDDAIEGFYKKFAELSKDGLSDADSDFLRTYYADIIAGGSGLADALAKIKGNTSVTIPIVIEPDVKLEALQNKLKALFDAGTIDAKDFGRAFQEIISEAVLEGFKAEIFADGLKGFYEKLSKLQSTGELNKDSIATLKIEYDKFVADAMAKLAKLEEATGLKFSQVIKEEISGTKDVINSEYQSLEDAITNIFANSNNQAEDFVNNFEELMKNAILNTFKATTLRDSLTGFYEEFKKLSTSQEGLTQENIAKLRAEYNKIIADSRTKLGDVEKITGVTFGGQDSQGSNLASSIGRSITEETGSELAGIWRVSLNETKIQTILMKQNNAIGSQILDGTLKIVINTGKIADNTASLDSKLQQLINNTKAVNTTNGRDAGVQIPVTVI